ncbi:MAG: hypothetical protein AAFR54_14300 [Planctomycetota bacterium]
MRAFSRHRARHQRSARSGTALVVSLVAVSVIAGLGAALIQVQSMMTKKQSFTIDRRAALYIAEAGLAESALAVSQGKSGIVATEDVPARFGRGVYWVESTDLPDDRLALVCTARVGTAEFMLRTVVLPNLNPVSSLGFFGSDGVEIGWGTVADGFHSSEGEYSTLLEPGVPVPTTARGARIGSNADVFLVETVSAELVDPRTTAGMTGLGTISGGGGGSAGSVTPGGGSGGSSSSGGSSGGGLVGGGTPGGENEGSGARGGSSGSLPGGGSSSPGGGAPGAGAPPGGWGGLVSSASGSGGGSSKDGKGGGSGSPTGGSSGGSSGGGSVTSLPGEPTWIFGFVRPGPRNSVRSNGFSILKGRIIPMRYPRSLPAVRIPTAAEILPADQVISSPVNFVGSLVETEVLGDVRVTSKGILTLVGPKVLIADSLVVEGGGALVIDDDAGPVDIFLRSGLELAAGSTVDSTGLDGDSRGTTISLAEVPGGARDRVTIEATGSYHGTLYAPSDSASIPAGLHWRGSAVARLLRTESGAKITVDERLSIGGLGVPTLPRILSWQIVPIGSGTARQLAVDPLVELALRGVTPVQSAVGAPESNVEIDYVDLTGQGATYNGLITGFAPTSARRIIGTSWDDPRGGPARRFLRPAGDDPAGAIAGARGTNRSLRTAIRVLTADPRVGFLTEDETIDLISSLPAAEIAAQAPDVKAADDRIGRADVAVAPAPFDAQLWMDDVTTKDDTGRADDDVTSNGAINVDGTVVTGN